jgi:hypothetical protein
MRAHARVSGLALLFCACLALSLTADGASAGSATLAYQDRLNDIIVQLMVPALAKRFDLLHRMGAVKLTYRVCASGEVVSVKLTSSGANHFVTDTCVRTIKSAKLPPIPQSVIKEQHHNYVDVETEIEINH